MFDVKKVREDFPMFKNNPNVIYLDNASTTFKPQCVIDAVNDYYVNESVNVHRGDYDLSYQVSKEYEDARETVAKFINAEPKEIVFTSGASMSLNLVAYGYGRKFLKKGDVILSTEAEHASNILPWFKVCEEVGTTIEYIPLTDQGEMTIEAFKKAIESYPNVKVIAMANVSNVLGYLQPIEEITRIAHEHGAIVVCDGAQSVPHVPCDVKKWGVDFLAFSGHKMCAPTGIGVLYGRYDLLQLTDPFMLGGGSNARFDICGNILLKDAPYKFESGTPAIEAVLGLKAAVEYLQNLGMENVYKYEHELRTYASEKLQELANITFFNPHASTGILTFNVNGVFAQDAASYLSSKGIAVRSGNHCAKILIELIKASETIRSSFYFYNTKEEVDKFIETCKDITVENCVGLFF